MNVFKPGDHGSTFGGNPLGAAVAREALKVLVEERMIENSAKQGAYALERLRAIRSPHIQEVRGRGLWIGIELKPQAGGARRFCEQLASRGHPLQGDAYARHPRLAAARHLAAGARLGA